MWSMTLNKRRDAVVDNPYLMHSSISSSENLTMHFTLTVALRIDPSLLILLVLYFVYVWVRNDCHNPNGPLTRLVDIHRMNNIRP